MDPALIPYIIIIAACVVMSGYFSGTETAFSSFNKTRMKTLAEKGNKRAKLVLKLSDNYSNLISTILIGNNIVNIAASSIGALLFAKLIADQNIATTVNTAVLTIVVLIFGEVTPKNMAKEIPEKFSMMSAPLIQLLVWIFMPFNFLFSLLQKLISKLLKSDGDDKMSQEELLMFVEEVEQDGSIDEDEGSMLRNVIEFNGLKAEDILTHRVDLVGFRKDTPKEEIARIYSESKFSRLLVYENTIDKIVGIVHQKDFYTAEGFTDANIEDIMTEPFFVPPSVDVGDLLKNFQENQSHIAVVVDEYGGTVGIVTMEDILEEIVGEIWDEHDEVVEDYMEIGENVCSVSCDVEMSDFCEHFDVEIETESTTLNGFLTEQLEKIPEKDDTFTYKNLIFTVIESDAHRSLFVKVEVLPVEEEEEEETSIFKRKTEEDDSEE
jgi:CBS domain containing-hemolysin-like protein